MKIVIINQHILDTLGGSEMQCDLIARGLSERGHQVQYFAVVKNNAIDQNRYKGLPYNVIPIDITGKCQIFSLLKKVNPDVVYWRYNRNHFKRAAKICNDLSIPFVFAVSHINDTQLFPSYKRVLEILKRKTFFKALKKIMSLYSYHLFSYTAFRYVDAVTSLNSEYLGLIPVRKQVTIWNAVPTQAGEFHWEKPYCLWVASIKAQKRPELYIALAKKISVLIPGLDFLMIGKIQDGFYDDVVKKATDMPNFHYLGPKSPEIVNKALAGAHCLIHTCQQEGFGNNFIQSWLMGCPTISYSFDPDNLMKTYSMGFISGTVDQMASDVILLWKNKALREQIIKRAMSFAKENMVPEVMCEKVERFLGEVIVEYRNTI